MKEKDVILPMAACTNGMRRHEGQSRIPAFGITDEQMLADSLISHSKGLTIGKPAKSPPKH